MGIYINSYNCLVHVLHWRVCAVLQVDLRFSHFFPRFIAWFSYVVCVCKREREMEKGRKKDCVGTSTVVYLHNCVCSFLYAMCSYSFYRWKKTTKKNERGKKKKKKDIQNIFVDFYFFFFFVKYTFLILVLDRNKKHSEIEDMISILDDHYCYESNEEELNDNLFIYLRIESNDRLYSEWHSLQKNAKQNSGGGGRWKIEYAWLAAIVFVLFGEG